MTEPVLDQIEPLRGRGIAGQGERAAESALEPGDGPGPDVGIDQRRQDAERRLGLENADSGDRRDDVERRVARH